MLIIAAIRTAMRAASRLVYSNRPGLLRVAVIVLGLVTRRIAPAENDASANANFAPNDPPGEWRSQARDFASTRYSPLSQITVDNVKRLRGVSTHADTGISERRMLG